MCLMEDIPFVLGKAFSALACFDVDLPNDVSMSEWTDISVLAL